MYDIAISLGSNLLKHLCRVLSHIPWNHWALMSFVVIIVILWCWKRTNVSGSGTLALALWTFTTLILLDTLVLRRIGIQIEQHPELNLVAEYHRLFHGSRLHQMYLLLNIASFVPFGFFFSEYLHATKRRSKKRIIGNVTLVAFLFSLGVECLQWILRIGLFELADMILNTLGALLGSTVSLGIRYAFRRLSRKSA